MLSEASLSSYDLWIYKQCEISSHAIIQECTLSLRLSDQ